MGSGRSVGLWTGEDVEGLLAGLSLVVAVVAVLGEALVDAEAFPRFGHCVTDEQLAAKQANDRPHKCFACVLAIENSDLAIGQSIETKAGRTCLPVGAHSPRLHLRDAGVVRVGKVVLQVCERP